MNDDELSQRLRALPRRTLPADWRREILAQAEAERATARPAWWQWLRQPQHAGWTAIAAAWVLIFLLQADARPPRDPNVPALDPETVRTQLLARQRRTITPELPPPGRPTGGLSSLAHRDRA